MFIFNFPIGKIYVEEENDYITKISFSKIDSKIKETDLTKKLYIELTEYFSGKRKYFDIPIDLKGTEFQMKVWNELLKIPYGETRTYKDLAESIGLKRGYQAVGNANNKNPLPIIIPCHRVIGVNGNLIGYTGGLYIKKQLLEIENLYK